MEIYLDHRFNGSMVVYSEAEAEAWVAKGWGMRPCQWTPAKYLKKAEPTAEPEAEAPRVGRPRKV